MTITFYGCPSQDHSSSLKTCAEYLADLQSALPLPHINNGCILGIYVVWATSPFARRYLGNRFYFLFLGLLRCFSSTGTLFRAKTPS